MRASETRATFARVIAGDLQPDQPILRFDPAIDRAIHFAEGEKLLTSSGDLVVLTGKGQSFVKELMRKKGCMEAEKEFLESLGRKLTQMQVDALLSVEAK